jgi:hypothetical protein
VKYFCLLFVFAFALCSKGQSVDSLATLISAIQKGENDNIRKSANDKFKSGLSQLLLSPNSSGENINLLKNVSVQESPDKKIKIFSWVLPSADGNNYTFFGFVQWFKDTSASLFELIDSTNTILKPESEKLRNDRWLGAIYYSIIPVKKSGKVYYTLLGWKAIDQKITQKIIDVLYIEGNKMKFGFPLFKTGSVYKNRMIFNYDAQASMSLRYDDEYKGLVFDHISTDKKNTAVPAGPDGTYDAFKLKKGKWILKKDVDVGIKMKTPGNLPTPPSKFY